MDEQEKKIRMEKYFTDTRSVETILKGLETIVKEARQLAIDAPGKYGGRYIAQVQWGDYYILDNDDPDELNEPGKPYADLVAHVSPNNVSPFGTVRYYLDNDGNTDSKYFDEDPNR